MKETISTLSVQDKYKYYERSVQCVGADTDFIKREFKNEFKREAKILREDFGGTGLLSCHWVSEDKDARAYAIDLDPEPIAYGREHHHSALTAEQKKRMQFIEGNVLDKQNFTPDIIVAFNFSYFIFKKRADLLTYFRKVRENLGDKGAFFLDLFGGSACHEPLEEETEHDDFSYFWDLDSINALKQEVLYHIHFSIDGVKHKNVFTYDWRMWGIQELADVLEDAGFSKVYTYWEGEDGEGSGNGEFFRATKEDNCESWVNYLMACP